MDNEKRIVQVSGKVVEYLLNFALWWLVIPLFVLFILGMFIGALFPDYYFGFLVPIELVITIWPLFATIIAIHRNFGKKAKTKVANEKIDQVKSILVYVYIILIGLSILTSLFLVIQEIANYGMDMLFYDSSNYSYGLGLLTGIFCIRYIKRFFKEKYQD